MVVKLAVPDTGCVIVAQTLDPVSVTPVSAPPPVGTHAVSVPISEPGVFGSHVQRRSVPIHGCALPQAVHGAPVVNPVVGHDGVQLPVSPKLVSGKPVPASDPEPTPPSPVVLPLHAG
jgi:hypothetical protein